MAILKHIHLKVYFMQTTTFYRDGLMKPSEWFSILSSVEAEKREESTSVYQLNITSKLSSQGLELEIGSYFGRTNETGLEEVKKLSFVRVRKLTSSELVYFTDIMTRNVSEKIVEKKEILDQVKKGEGASFLTAFLEENFPSTEKLEEIKVKIKARFVENGFKGFICSIFSAIANFFRKYNLYRTTGIYWPGNTHSYVCKVIAKRQNLIDAVLEANKKELSKNLGIPFEQFVTSQPDDLKKIYRDKVLELHPDKSKEKSHESFQQLERVWKDFLDLAVFDSNAAAAPEQNSFNPVQTKTDYAGVD